MLQSPHPGIACEPAPFAALDLGLRLDGARSEQEMTELGSGFFRRFGVDTVVCGRLPGSRADLEAGLWYNSRPPSWNDAYIRHNMLRADPVLQELRRTPRALTWSEALGRRKLGNAQRLVMGTARDFGMTEGLVVPVFDTRGTSGIVSLAGAEMDLSASGRVSLTMAAVYFYNHLCALRRGPQASALLTRRETEILKWIVAGKSDWQIGQILHISSKTVNFHVENVKRKFGVATRIQAVVAAVQHGNMHI